MGPGTIHLTGNILELDENEMDDDDDDGESEDDMVDELKNLRWTEQQIKQLQNNEDSDDDSDNDDGENENEEDGEDGSEEEDDEEESKDDDSEDKKQVLPPTSKPETVVKQTKTPNGVNDQKSPKKEIESTIPKTPKTPDVETVTSKKSKDNQISEATPKKTVKNGIIIEELVEGSGVACKNGNGVGMFYRGRLKTSKKAFDACQSGKPFRFKLGAGKVIKGWDVGVLGMKVGGKRRLTIPSKLGYGGQGAPPDIPPNADLVFDIECKFVK